MQPEGVKHGMCMAVQLYTQSSKPGLHALVGYEDGTAAVWDASNGKMLASKRLHVEPIMAAAVTPDGSGKLLTLQATAVHCMALSASGCQKLTDTRVYPCDANEAAS